MKKTIDYHSILKFRFPENHTQLDLFENIRNYIFVSLVRIVLHF